MALHFGFGLYYSVGEKRKVWEDKFQALTEAQKKFYHGALPFYMMGWGIHHISKETIEEIILRETYFPWSQIEWDRMPEMKDKTVEERRTFLREYLTPFIGYQTNVAFETIHKWMDRWTKREMEKSLFKSEKSIDKEWTAFHKWMDAEVAKSLEK